MKTTRDLINILEFIDFSRVSLSIKKNRIRMIVFSLFHTEKKLHY